MCARMQFVYQMTFDLLSGVLKEPNSRHVQFKESDSEKNID